MQLGGALGNLTDRLARTHVTDFISVWNFPVFNFADASIFLGVIILGYGMWQSERQAARLAREAEGTGDPVDDDPALEVTPSEAEGESFGA